MKGLRNCKLHWLYLIVFGNINFVLFKQRAVLFGKFINSIFYYSKSCQNYVWIVYAFKRWTLFSNIIFKDIDENIKDSPVRNLNLISKH